MLLSPQICLAIYYQILDLRVRGQLALHHLVISIQKENFRPYLSQFMVLPQTLLDRGLPTRSAKFGQRQ